MSTAKGATYGRSVRLLIFGDRDLSRSMSPRINIFVTAAWVPSAEACVITAVRADGADAKELTAGVHLAFRFQPQGGLQLHPLYVTHMGAFAPGRMQPVSEIANRKNARHADWQRPAKDLTGLDRDQP